MLLTSNTVNFAFAEFFLLLDADCKIEGHVDDHIVRVNVGGASVSDEIRWDSRREW